MISKALFSIVLPLLTLPGLYGQASNRPAVNPNAPGPVAPIENAWLATVRSDHLGSAPPNVRGPRDEYFDALVGLPTPLTPETAAGMATITGSSFATSPEIPIMPNRKLTIATFTGAVPILTASQHAIYSEVSLKIVDILDNNESPVAHINDVVTLIVPGGTVIKDDGTVLSFLAHPVKTYIGPGRTFLLVLSYHPAGDFYTFSKAWDVSSGTAQPSYGFHHKPESITGLSVPQLSQQLKTQFGSK